MKLFQDNLYGPSYQAQAVLAYIRQAQPIQISGDRLIDIEYFEWYNGREQGYVIHVYNHGAVIGGYDRQYNIAFFEHRNGSDICAVDWYQTHPNPITTYQNADFGVKYQEKGDVSFRVEVGEAMAMADWIRDKIEEFIATRT